MYRSLAYLLPLLIGSTTLLAQVQKGQTITSGGINVAFSSEKTVETGSSRQSRSNNSALSFGFSANRGVFIKDNLLLGCAVGVQYEHSEANSHIDNQPALFDYYRKSINVTTNVFLRYYWPATSRLYVYIGGGLAGSSQGTQTRFDRLEDDKDDYYNKNTRWEMNPLGQLGAMYKVTNRIALMADMSSNSFPINFSTAQLGISLLTGQHDGQTVQQETLDAFQTQQGRWLIGLSANVVGLGSTSITTDSTIFLLNRKDSWAATSLQIGRFWRPGLVAGITLNYWQSRVSIDNPAVPSRLREQTYRQIAFGSFMRQYIGIRRLRPFWQLGIQHSSGSYERSEFSDKSVEGQISGGLAYMIGQRFIIQTTLGTFSGGYQWESGLPENIQNGKIEGDLRGSTLSNFAVYYVL